MRFITEDTNKGKIEDPLSLNLYTYSKGNPIQYYDSDGHWAKEINDAIKGALFDAGVTIGVGVEIVKQEINNTVEKVAEKVAPGLTNAIEKGVGEAETTLPTDESILKHIFRNDSGHLLDTEENRNLFINVSNNQSNYMGKDEFGNDWYASIQKDGSQVWTEARDGKVWDAGVNSNPRPWNDKTGLKQLQPPKKAK